MDMGAGLQASAAARFKFNPFDPAFRADPHPTYDRLRAEMPYFRTLGTVVLTRYDSVMEVLKSRNFSVALIPTTISEHAAKLGLGGIEQVERFIRKSIVFTDNPEHARLRRLVGQAYSAAAVEGLSRLIEREVDRLIDRVAPSGTMDVIRDLAEPLPLDVLCEWMGVSPDERSYVGPRIHAIRLLLDPGLMARADFRNVVTAMRELSDYFAGRLAAGIGAGDEDNLMRRLGAARSDDDRLSDEEVVFACIMSFVAGNETTQCLIGNTIDALLSFPDQLRRLRRDRSLTAAVEETLRFEPPLQMTKRQAITAVRIGDYAFRPGEQVLLCLAAANRDPRWFSAPHAYDLSRQGPAHVGFGYGMHACLGGLLARKQAEAVLNAFLTRFATFERDGDGAVRQSHSLILRGLETLPIRFTLQ